MLLWDNGPEFEQAENFKLGTDSVLLAAFAETRSYKRGIDLGCGSGILPLLIMERSAGISMTGLEIDPAAAETARHNMAINGLDGRSDIVTGDIKNCRELFKPGEFDFVISNPPYFAEGSGKRALGGARAAARGETMCSLHDVCLAAKFLCRSAGSFNIVHRADRLADVICLMRETGFEPKRLRLIAHAPDKPPSLFLLEARRDGSPGLTVLPGLYITNGSGAYSEEIKRIYHREDEP